MALPLAELDFIREVVNHRDFCRKLGKLGLVDAEAEVRRQALEVGVQWFLLGNRHLQDARSALRGRARRSAYSRAYYAVYNASKAVRYIATGSVSLKGDDHAKAPDLPGDFPEASKWGSKITTLYEHRLRADYDNWSDPNPPFSISTTSAIADAAGFILACRHYLEDVHGVGI
jgi:hypothetical protein